MWEWDTGICLDNPSETRQNPSEKALLNYFFSHFHSNFSFPLFCPLQPGASDKMEQTRAQGNCLQRWGTFLWRVPELVPRARRWQLVPLWSRVRARGSCSCYTFTNLCHSGALPLHPHPPRLAPSFVEFCLGCLLFFNPSVRFLSSFRHHVRPGINMWESLFRVWTRCLLFLIYITASWVVSSN